MVGRCISYWNDPFPGDMLVFRGVAICLLGHFPWCWTISFEGIHFVIFSRQTFSNGRKLHHGNYEIMVGILVSFWDGLFSGAMLVSGSVENNKKTQGHFSSQWESQFKKSVHLPHAFGFLVHRCERFRGFQPTNSSHSIFVCVFSYQKPKKRWWFQNRLVIGPRFILPKLFCDPKLKHREDSSGSEPCEWRNSNVNLVNLVPKATDYTGSLLASQKSKCNCYNLGCWQKSV